MPSALFAKMGIKQSVAYGLHMFMYGTPLLTFLQVETITIFDEIIQNPLLAFEKRVFSDYDFLFGLVFLVLLDSVAGGMAAWKTILLDAEGNPVLNFSGKAKRQFSQGVFNEKMSKKLAGITISVLCIGILKNTIISGEENWMAFVVDAGFYSVMLGFEGASVLKNAYKVYPYEPIKIALKKLEVFYDKNKDKIEP